MTASRTKLLRARTTGAIARARLAAAVATLTLCPALAAQVHPAPAGWSISTSFQESAQPALVRSTLQWNRREHLVAIGPRLFRTGAHLAAAGRPLLDLGPGEDIAFVVPHGVGQVAVGSLRSGRVLLVDPDRGLLGTFAGVANAFAAAAIGSDLLVVANPLWPQPGAHSGVWLSGPNQSPREVLPLVGPSGPLVLKPNGDLVVGELGPIVPPPPGAARLLLVPANRVAAAVAGATLSMADVAAIGAGWSGLYGLAVDDQDRLHASDPASSAVRHTAPGGLVPVGSSLDVGSARFALGLQFLPGATAPFRGYQPAAAAPALAVGSSDFATGYEWLHLRPKRPLATVAAGTTVPAGPFVVAVTAAPPLGMAIACASAPGAGPEAVVATWDGTPLWCGLLLPTAFFVASAPADASGSASFVLQNPGGTAGAIDLQVLAVGPGGGEPGTTNPLHLYLLP